MKNYKLGVLDRYCTDILSYSMKYSGIHTYILSYSMRYMRYLGRRQGVRENPSE